MKPITATLLVKCGASVAHVAPFVAPLDYYARTYGLTTPLRIAHFLAQIIHESQGLTRMDENLNYSAEALMRTWKTRFRTRAVALEYARQPRKIANYVYANRLGNGPVESGDGWTYRGRGPIQMTGKDKYVRLTKLFQIDYVNHPEYLERPEDGVRAAFQFWQDMNLNLLADQDDAIAVSKKINGGINGLTERQMLTLRCKGQVAHLFT